MLVTLIPLFDENMTIRAYSLFTQKENYFLNPIFAGTGALDGAGRVDGLEVIQSMGIETLSADKDVFVTVSSMNIFSDLTIQCDAPHDRLVLLLEPDVKPNAMFIDRIKQLKEMGYKFGMHKLAVQDFQAYTEILKLMDYIFLNHKKVDLAIAKKYFHALFPHITLCAVNVQTVEDFGMIREKAGFSLYEGNFYQVPITKGEHQVTPLKANYISLINKVNEENYDLSEAADIIGNDPALTIELLRMVNNISVNSEVTSLRHAAAMLGQKELKRWITTAALSALCTDKPSEIMRVSMLRGKFAENLAAAFGFRDHSSEAFILGLFSVLDVVLETTMEDALSKVNVSHDVKKTLLNQGGRFEGLYNFIIQYEKASWQEVSRQMILLDLDMNTLYNAYIEALVWYRKLMLGK